MDVIHVFKCSLMSGFQETSLVRKFVDSSSGCPVFFQQALPVVSLPLASNFLVQYLYSSRL